ncbi:hypothetical protein DFJ43DRAFT_1001803, partial [Lentinula guzmanii]
MYPWNANYHEPPSPDELPPVPAWSTLDTYGWFRGGTNNSSSSSSSRSSRDSYDRESLPDAAAIEASRQEIINLVRRRYDIPESDPVDLTAISDTPDGSRPDATLAKILHLAIAGSPRKKLTLREIFLAIKDRFAWYKNSEDKRWQGSIRHMLSMKAEFVQVPRPFMEPGQGHYWTLNMNLTGDKRVRKR